MKIEGTCGTCGRTFLFSQIGPDSDVPGRCPFCGARFARHYRGTLVETVQATEVAANDLVHALQRLESIETGFTIDTDSLLANLQKQVDEHERAG